VVAMGEPFNSIESHVSKQADAAGSD
jgi:hypothetical protein